MNLAPVQDLYRRGEPFRVEVANELPCGMIKNRQGEVAKVFQRDHGRPDYGGGVASGAAGQRRRTFLFSCCYLHGTATDRLPIDRTTFVVAETWLIVGEEHLADEVAPTAHTGLLEDALQVLLNGMGRDEQFVCDLRRGVAAKDQPRYLLLPLSQPIRRHEQG